ncbi:hypothetical protein [Bacteroides sp.]|uniref:hypothetical protein n=1 Tax=Bacteroides sp. TaxID=29523 RepID=UPI0025C1636D|nr:hypothetical protein [Bacteroides sp.]
MALYLYSGDIGTSTLPTWLLLPAKDFSHSGVKLPGESLPLSLAVEAFLLYDNV